MYACQQSHMNINKFVGIYPLKQMAMHAQNWHAHFDQLKVKVLVFTGLDDWTGHWRENSPLNPICTTQFQKLAMGHSLCSKDPHSHKIHIYTVARVTVMVP